MKKYEQIVQDIKGKILSHEYPVNELIPSELSLQKKYGVSRYTVRQALSILVNDKYVRKEHGSGSYAIDEYLNNNSSSNDLKTIGIITTYFSDYIFPSIMRGIEETLRNRGYSLLIASTNNDFKQEKQCLEMLMDQNVCGIIIEPTKSNLINPNIPYYLSFKQSKMPVVMFNAFYEELSFPYLKLDDVKASFLTTNYLIENNHKNIVLITKSDDIQGKQRYTGFIKAFRESDMTMDQDNIFTYSTENRNEVVENVVKRIIDNKEITAVVSYNDDIANMVIKELMSYDISVPGDISVVGIDNAYISYAGQVPITTATHPQEQIGIDAANMLIDIIQKKKVSGNKIYEPELIIRDSVSKI